MRPAITRSPRILVSSLLWSIALLLGVSSAVYADNMSSTTYRLQFGNFNITSGTKTSSSYNITDTVGQTAAGQFGLSGNVVKSGFQYIYPLERFTFKVAPQTIAFGSLTLGSFSTATQTLEVTAVGAGGYNVTVSEDHAMQMGANLLRDGDMEVPDTSAWTSGFSATLSKQSAVQHTGTKGLILRVAYGGTSGPFGYQTSTTVVGRSYRITGWFRGDGTFVPRIAYAASGGTILSGTTSTSWQPFDVTAVADSTSGFLLRSSANASGYAEFDDVIVSIGATIPDTLCDTTCSETTAAAWSNVGKFGFGYTITGSDVVTGFSSGTNFKQFANLATGETPQTIMSSVSVGTKRHSVLTYKINVSAQQPAGEYTTTINYIAIPGY